MNEFVVSQFPDGQITTTLKTGAGDDVRFHKTTINSYEDLFVLGSYVDSLDANSITLPNIYIPCMFGQRSDRRFDRRESFSLKVITDYINNLGFPSVGVFDPHSDVTLALIDRSFRMTPDPYIVRALEHFETEFGKNDEQTVLISPDAGAYKKVFKLAEGMDTQLVAANKFRSLSGEIDLVVSGDVTGQNCFIVDDLADGGYTFHILAEKLKKLGAAKVGLYVSHGYFKQGFDLLSRNIDKFYTTNSVCKHSNSDILTVFTLPERFEYANFTT